jgi:uncharacterized C2H2 Zn-finger protein
MTVDKRGYVYIFQPREHIRMNESVFKIGLTQSENCRRRFLQYPKGTKVLCFSYVEDCFWIEAEAKRVFAHKFKMRDDLGGTELFEGCSFSMKKELDMIIENGKGEVIPCEKKVPNGRSLVPNGRSPVPNGRSPADLGISKNKSIGTLSCDSCCFETTRNQSYQRHMKSTHHLRMVQECQDMDTYRDEDGKIFFGCKQCSFTSKRMQNMRRHITALHEATTAAPIAITDDRDAMLKEFMRVLLSQMTAMQC